MKTTSAGLDRETTKYASESGAPVSFSEIISALSLALDLTEGALQGHALRSCLLGMRIAATLQLTPVEMHDLYFALLLKDIGCSSNAARMCQIVGGDDRAVKAAVKLEDWTKPNQPKLSTLKMLWSNVLPEANPADRLVRIVRIGLSQHRNNEELITLRCNRGASIVHKIGLGKDVAEAVRCLDEHWDGSGYPDRSLGSRIPILARIMQVAQNLDVFSTERSPEAAVSVMLERSGGWFDPGLVKVAIALHRRGDLWKECRRDTHPEETRRAVLDIEPGVSVELTSADMDRICEAFAEVVDAKSHFTYRHSVGVARAALGIAQIMGFSAERAQFLHRAALLHDIGKLNVSNSILDKPGKPTSAESIAIRQHPAITRRILERVGALREIAIVAGEHHEKLDGSGYPNGLAAEHLSLESRILAVADIYSALTEDRPYRRGLPMDMVSTIISNEVPDKLDKQPFEALRAYMDRGEIAATAFIKPISLPAVRS